MSAQAVLAYIANRDQRLMRKVNGWRAPRWIRLWMVYATRGGDGWLWYAMGAIILLFGGPERYAAVGASALATAIGILLFIKLKRICNRQRPCAMASALLGEPAAARPVLIPFGTLRLRRLR